VQNNWSKEKRLRRSEDFQAVWSAGQSWPHTLFVLWALPNDFPYSRIGIIASRKVGNAVARNRARRLLKEAARHLYTSILSGWDIVLVARSTLLETKAPNVEVALQNTLQRARLHQDSRS
jgi:ribonuclease P protein component